MSGSISRFSRSFSTSEDIWSQVEEEARRHGISMSAIVNEALEVYFGQRIKRSSWETTDESSWYDEKKFYTFSEDKKGHSAYLRMRVPKNLAGQIGRIVNSGEIPELRSSYDFYRDALFHRAHQVAEWLDDGVLKKEVGVLMLLSEEHQVRQAREDAEDLLESTRANLDAAYKRGDYAWLRAHINRLYETTNSVPELYRGEYVALLDEYLGKEGVRVEGGSVTRMKNRRTG